MSLSDAFTPPASQLTDAQGVARSVIATLCTLRRHLPNQDIELIKPLIYAGLAQPNPNHDSIVNLTRIFLI